MAAVMASGCAATAITTPVTPPVQAHSNVTAGTPSTSSSTTPPTPSTTLPVPTTTTTTVPPVPPTAVVRPCPLSGTTPSPVDGEPVSASVGIAHSLVCSATDVVVTRSGDYDSGARLARDMAAPLVYASADSPYDPAPLGAARVWTTDPSLVVSGRHSVLPFPDRAGKAPQLTASIEDGSVPDAAVRASIEGAEHAPTLVVVSRHQPHLGPVAEAAATAVDATVVWTAPGDMRRRRSLAGLAEAADHHLLVGDFAGSAAWQMDVLSAGRQLPGGGQVLFPGRRLVALYGHPHTARLGVLGEQTPADAVARASELAQPYATDDVPVIPTFEIIATTATSTPGKDGDYSTELSVEELRPWVKAAGEAGYYVVLDLQPGRRDFLTQAKRYEELLRLPHVGLALDPEWRLGPQDLHLRQIGSVTASEVNTVAVWLAGLVREERLPQKLLLVHQFKLSMIRDRHEIVSPSELAVVIQMDGQGPLGTKHGTWDALLAADDRNWLWGWKNFFDEDSPTPRPDQVLDLEPDPVFVSYQ